MKSSIEDSNQNSKEPKFPILKKLINKEIILIVLFTSETNGTCIFSSAKNREVGEVSHSWAPCSDKSVWEDFKGKVILEN